MRNNAPRTPPAHNFTRFTNTGLTNVKAIGSSPNAVRMQKVVGFYEKLPRGAAPEIQAKGLLGRYQKKYMGKNASAMRTSNSRRGAAALEEMLRCQSLCPQLY